MSSEPERAIPQAKPASQQVIRPWGSFMQYARNHRVTVSLMTVAPGQRLSLQSHRQRAELWIALDDHALIQVGDEIIQAAAGQEVWIPAGVQHRLSSSGPATRVLEVAFGSWRQDDIQRYADDYQRPSTGE